MCLRRKTKGVSRVLAGGFCLRDSEAVQKALRFLHIYYPNVNSYSSAPESSKQNPPDLTVDVPSFYHYGHITSLKDVPSPATSERLPHCFKATLRLCLF